MKPAAGAAPTRCVGESGVTSSGCASSSACELVVERVVGGVGDLRVVEDVVAVGVVLDQPPELLDPRPTASDKRRGAPRGCWTRASGSSARSRSSGWIPPQPTATANAPAAFAGPDVERRVADVDRLLRRRAEAPQRLEDRVGIGLVALGVLGADEHVGQLARGPGSGRTRARRSSAASPSRSRAGARGARARAGAARTPSNVSSVACSGSLWAR